MRKADLEEREMQGRKGERFRERSEARKAMNR